MEQLVEGAFSRLFASRLHAHEIAVKLARALEDHLQPAADGDLAAPDAFTVRLHPADAAALLEADPGLAAGLARDLLTAAREAGLVLHRPPRVDLLPDADVPPRGLLVEARGSGRGGETVGITPVARPLRPSEHPAAFLIIGGERHVALDRPVVSIGRRPDNHIVLDHPQVSRTHAQLRVHDGRYVLYDLGSTGGTQVNGKPVQERSLRPGDVISVAGVSLIYGEEEPAPPPEIAPTRPLSAVGAG